MHITYVSLCIFTFLSIQVRCSCKFKARYAMHARLAMHATLPMHAVHAVGRGGGREQRGKRVYI